MKTSRPLLTLLLLGAALALLGSSAQAGNRRAGFVVAGSTSGGVAVSLPN